MVKDNDVTAEEERVARQNNGEEGVHKDCIQVHEFQKEYY